MTDTHTKVVRVKEIAANFTIDAVPPLYARLIEMVMRFVNNSTCELIYEINDPESSHDLIRWKLNNNVPVTGASFEGLSVNAFNHILSKLPITLTVSGNAIGDKDIRCVDGIIQFIPAVIALNQNPFFDNHQWSPSANPFNGMGQAPWHPGGQHDMFKSIYNRTYTVSVVSRADKQTSVPLNPEVTDSLPPKEEPVVVDAEFTEMYQRTEIKPIGIAESVTPKKSGSVRELLDKWKEALHDVDSEDGHVDTIEIHDEKEGHVFITSACASGWTNYTLGVAKWLLTFLDIGEENTNELKNGKTAVAIAITCPESITKAVLSWKASIGDVDKYFTIVDTKKGNLWNFCKFDKLLTTKDGFIITILLSHSQKEGANGFSTKDIITAFRAKVTAPKIN